MEEADAPCGRPGLDLLGEGLSPLGPVLSSGPWVTLSPPVPTNPLPASVGGGILEPAAGPCPDWNCAVLWCKEESTSPRTKGGPVPGARRQDPSARCLVPGGGTGCQKGVGVE